MLAAFAVLWALRKNGKPVGWLFGLYLVFAGIERFLVEILRAKDDRFLGPFTLAQLTSAIIVVIGLALLVAALVYGLLGGVVAGVIAGLAPALAANEVLGMVARVGILIAIIVGLVPLFRDKPAGTIIGVHES